MRTEKWHFIDEIGVNLLHAAQFVFMRTSQYLHVRCTAGGEIETHNLARLSILSRLLATMVRIV